MSTDPSWGFSDDSLPSWGGLPVKIDEEYHLFGSYVAKKCDIRSYGTNSAVFRAVSRAPQGPYVFQQQLLRPFHHGAHALRRNGRVYVFADGKDVEDEVVHDCTGKGDVVGMPSKNRNNPKIKTGLWAFGDTPHDRLVVASSEEEENGGVRGNWTEHVVMKTDLDAGLLCNRTNPSPAVMPDGSWVVAVRTTYCSKTGYEPVCYFGANCEHISIFKMDSPTSFMRTADLKVRVMQLEASEDPFYWIDPKTHVHYMLVHSKNACGKEGQQRCGLLAFSQDGIKWTSASRSAYAGHVTWRSTGKREVLELMQRPKILFAEDGSTPLFLFVGVRRRMGEGGRKIRAVHTLAIPFNVPQNSHLRVTPVSGSNSSAADPQDEAEKVNILLQEHQDEVDEEDGDDSLIGSHSSSNGGRFQPNPAGEVDETEDSNNPIDDADDFDDEHSSMMSSRKANTFTILIIVLGSIFLVAMLVDVILRRRRVNLKKGGEYVKVQVADGGEEAAVA